MCARKTEICIQRHRVTFVKLSVEVEISKITARYFLQCDTQISAIFAL